MAVGINAAILADKSPWPVEEPHLWNGTDVEALGERIVPTLAIKEFRPCHAVVCDELVQAVSVLIQGDADDLEALGMIFIVNGDNVGYFFAARRAPRCPEVQKDN